MMSHLPALEGRMRRLCVLPALLYMICAAYPPEAQAQLRRMYADNPSQSGPSSRLGIVGGANTYSPTVIRIAPRTPNVGMPTFSMAPRRNRPSGSGQPVAPLRLGMVASPGRRSLFREGFLSDFDVGAASGFNLSIAPDTPLYGWQGLNMLRGENTPVQATEPKGAAYHRFFDLTPSRPPPESVMESYDNLLDLLDQRNDDRVAELCQQAFDAFADATASRSSPGDAAAAEERSLRLSDAERLFGAARELMSVGQESVTSSAPELPILNVLEAHAHLEGSRTSGVAINEALLCLARAARCDPDTFYRLSQARRNEGAERSLATYFGDYRDGRSGNLERQMLQYVQATTDSSDLESLLLQAYCAWMLGDSQRASRALNEAEKTLRERAADRSSENWNGLVAALRYAL